VIEFYLCTNDECDAVTTVTRWPATRVDPEDSTWGDGCEGCGDELQEEPIDIDDMYDPDPPDYPADEERY
jgi:hypothetical protein